MICFKCKRRYKTRAIYLAHIAVCNRLDNQIDGSSSSEVDDSDADPMWSPGNEYILDDDLQQHSPVTAEQADIAAETENLLIDIPLISPPTSPPTSALPMKVAAIDADGINIDSAVMPLISTSPVKVTAINADVVNIDNTVEDCSNERRRKRELIAIRIEQWKQKLKEAVKTGKRSSARRLSQKIRKQKEAMAIVEPNVPGSDNTQAGDFFGEEELTSKKKQVRKKNFCLHCNKFVSKFSEHVESRHRHTPEGEALRSCHGPDKRLQKMRITDPLRKKWNLLYNERNSSEQIIPVKKRHGGKPVPSIVCLHCKGVYRRDKLSVHLKSCQPFLTKNLTPEQSVAAIKGHSSVYLPLRKHVSDEFYNNVLQGMPMNEVTEAALKDPFILKYSSSFYHSRREPSSKSYVTRIMRDLTKLFLNVKEINPNINSFVDVINPIHFDTVVQAVLNSAGYDQGSGSICVPSVAYRILQPLKEIVQMIRSDAVKEIYELGSTDRSRITSVDDFLAQINTNWKVRIGRVCRKAQKVARVSTEQKMSIEKDIIKLAAYLQNQYNSLIINLDNGVQTSKSYDKLTHVIVSHIMLLIRRRPVDFKHAKLLHYNSIDKHDDLLGMIEGDLGEEQLNACKQFHIFFVPGKNLDVVPMVLTPLMKKGMECLIRNRESVGITCDTLFILSKNKFISPTESLTIMKKEVKLEKPKHLTGNGLRHQAATFSRLRSNHPQYQDYLASVLGHTLAVHKKHYDLPQGVIQKIMVCPILHQIMTGEKAPASDVMPTLPELEENMQVRSIVSDGESEEHEQFRRESQRTPKAKTRWSEEEQHVVLQHFGEAILLKKPPTRTEVVEFLKIYGNLLPNRTIPQVYIYLRNHALRTQCNVTPKVERIVNKLNTF